MASYRGSKIVPIRFPESVLAKLDWLCAFWKVRRSVVIRKAVEQVFKETLDNDD